jgi:subtilisin family serine protease
LQQQLRFTEGRKIFRGFTAADTLATSRPGRPVRLIDLSRWYTLKVADTTDVAALVERLAKLPGIEAAAPEYPVAPHDVFPNDPEFQLGNQWGLHNTFRPGNDIHAPAAWSYNKGRSDVVVAVVDGGVDYNHADLDPGNRSRVIQGYDTADNDSDPMDDIPAGQGFANHGTQVAGVIGALTNNGTQVAGVLWNTQIMPIKIAYTDGPWWDPFQMFSGPGSAFRTNIGQGIDYARSHGADIINLSLGSPAEDAPGTWELFFLGNPVGEAIWNAYQQGVTVFASSGNDSDAQVGYPASHPGALAVGRCRLYQV